MNEAPEPPNPLGTAAIVTVAGLLVGLGLYRIPPVDVPWHLATGRWILEHGAFPVANTFSWTHPAHALHQQYPLFQVPLALIADGLGWEAVSIVNALAWAFGVALWGRFGGTWRDAAAQPLSWWLVVAGVQRHHLARPEVLTVIGLGALLVALDRFAATRRSRWLVLAVVAQWVLVNGHQMWPIGIALYAAFLVHLGAVRTGWGRLDPADHDVPWRPAAIGFAASIGVLAVSPLGLGVFLAPLTTLDTLLSQGQATVGGAQAAELAPVWSDPLSAVLAAVSIATATAWIARSWARRRVHPFDLAVFGMGTVMVLVAIRGMPFVALAAGVVASRSRTRTGPFLPAGSPVRAVAAIAAVALTLALGRALLGQAPACDRVERGLGQTRCGWGEPTTAFLRADPPPGELLNLGWVAGNPLILGLWPARGVFVDPRWEAYPRPFLLEAIAAVHDGAKLQQLIAEWSPGFVVVETREGDAAARAGELVEAGWPIVWADTDLWVLVRPSDDDVVRAWLTRHPPIEPSRITPASGWSPLPVIRAQQQLRFARMVRAVGGTSAEALIAEARTVDDVAVQRLLAEVEPATAMDPAPR